MSLTEKMQVTKTNQNVDEHDERNCNLGGISCLHYLLDLNIENCVTNWITHS